MTFYDILHAKLIWSVHYFIICSTQIMQMWQTNLHSLWLISKSHSTLVFFIKNPHQNKWKILPVLHRYNPQQISYIIICICWYQQDCWYIVANYGMYRVFQIKGVRSSYNKLTYKISGIYVSQLMFWDKLCIVDPSNNLISKSNFLYIFLHVHYQFKCAIILPIVLIDASYMMNVPLLFETPCILHITDEIILQMKLYYRWNYITDESILQHTEQAWGVKKNKHMI